MRHYEDILQPLDSISLEQVINIAKDLLPNEYKHKPWQLTNHGTNVIDNVDCLCAYLVAYGEMHNIKCRAACQNFPFADIYNYFEIVDWGCGQGIASMSVLEIFRERELLNSYLKKITLIEPSAMALQRALMHIAKSVAKDVEIEHLNVYMPGVEENVIESLEFNYPITIHLFSNILDIPTINLRDLSKILVSSGHKHYVLCIGPLNVNAKRIDEFCEYFSPTQYFSNISNYNYGITTDTHYQFGCKTKCFEFQTNNLVWNGNVKESSYSENYEDDYSESFIERILPQGSKELYCKLVSQLDAGDNIFIKPNINGDIPDFAIIRPGKGIMLINICSDGKVDKGKMEQNLGFIKTYQENLLKEYIDVLLSKSFETPRYWSVIKTMLYFPNIAQLSLLLVKECLGKTCDDKCLEINNKIYTEFVGCDMFKYSDYNLLKSIKSDCSLFTNEIYDSFMRIVIPKYHSYKEGIRINLTKQQKKLSKSTEGGRQKIKGVSGSGKTQVLVSRAVNAHIRCGDEVLILTFNIMLVNYIRHRISKVAADFLWNKFHITNYHQFFKTQANNHRLKTELNSFDDITFFKEVSEHTHRYKAILIDEIQDYQPKWIEIITKYFLAENGEFFVCGDAKQNVYHNILDENKDIKVKTISGEWNESLNRGFRYSNGKLTDLAMAYQRHFFSDHNHDTIINDPKLGFEEKTFFKYASIPEDIDYDRIACWINKVLVDYNLNQKDTVILSQSNDFLRKVEQKYRKLTGSENTITCESQELYDKLFNKRDIDSARKNKKIHFSMDTPLLKLSTIHSFKGWEANSIILFIEQGTGDNSKELIYTAITRAKKNLFIFNIGNSKYDEFFKKFK